MTGFDDNIDQLISGFGITPTEEEFKAIRSQLLDNALESKTIATMRIYIRKWAS